MAGVGGGSAEALRYGVAKVLEEEGARAGAKFSPAALRTAHELVSQFVNVCADDMAAYSRHAKRQTITHDDVALAVRHSPEATSAVAEAVEASRSGRAAKRRAKAATAAVPSAKRPAAAEAAAPAAAGGDGDDDLADEDFLALDV